MSKLANCARALAEAGAPTKVVARWEALRAAIVRHQSLLADHGIGKEVSERDRVRVNARRVGLEAPLFADEAQLLGFGERNACIKSE